MFGFCTPSEEIGQDLYISAYSENTFISFLRIWRRRISPFHVLREYAEILSAYEENTQKSFPRTERKYEYAERIFA